MTSQVKWRNRIGVVLLAAGAAACAADAGSPAGLGGEWDAVVQANGVEVPFRFEVTEEGGRLTAAFFNGDRRVSSTSAGVNGAQVSFVFGQYASAVEASIVNGRLEGRYRRARGEPYPFRAARGVQTPAPVPEGTPSIDGTWIVKAKSSKGEEAWRFIARQGDSGVEATILRVDGDTGTLTGGWRDGRYVLSHFSGARPLLLEVTPRADGTIALSQNGREPLAAARESESAIASIGTPTDPAEHTRVKDPSEPFRFSFPDLEGRLVSNTDAELAGKVVLVNISGSWCPNCHDEAPFLSELYRKYRDRGLQIVALSFEEAGQLDDPVRLRTFIETYGIEYTVLVAGEPDQLNEKVPQGENLNAFPTTFVLGRDGRVRAVHAGFPSPGSGEYYTKAVREITALVEALLAESTS